MAFLTFQINKPFFDGIYSHNPHNHQSTITNNDYRDGIAQIHYQKAIAVPPGTITTARINLPRWVSTIIRMSAATGTTPRKTTGSGKNKKAIKETLLATRFYTTDFDEMEQLFNVEMNKNLNEVEFVVLLQEFKTDYNQTHFVWHKEFKKAANEIQGPLRKIFVEFLERSCTAEFSRFSDV
ncbi:hypothetical protein E3N88_17053 [Mikania micrantha]|uniref:Uncharacterized protein n=1 Tax=Mikania micrantha TaxID=192012 RepID=A0A5N6NTR6_9ASTR|nr:hypothetical protein E3N88_17053 [Mikania micrantha]